MTQSAPKRLLGDQSPGMFRRRTYTPLWKQADQHPTGFWLLGQAIRWFDTHYQDGVVPCIASFAPRCSWCALGWRPRPRGFIMGMHARTGGVYALTVTLAALESCPGLGVTPTNLRGLAATVRRRGCAKNSAWVWTIEALPPPPMLPPAPDLFDFLERLWEIDLRRLNACPPMDGDLTPMFHNSTHTRRD